MSGDISMGKRSASELTPEERRSAERLSRFARRAGESDATDRDAVFEQMRKAGFPDMRGLFRSGITELIRAAKEDGAKE